jgi:hypothetical protein
MKAFVRTILLLSVFAGAREIAGAQTVAPRLSVPRVITAPQLSDFSSMEVVESPRGMRRVEGFVQRFPSDGQPVSERTVAYVGYDQEFFYVAFQCFDRAPGRIGAHMVQRDAFPADEDSVAVHVDTFRDLQHAYGFQVNPYGVQTDGIYTEGAGWDLSWDTVWRSESTRTTRGYAVLIGIPFKSLRFPATETQQWGLFLYRGIPRNNEDAFWPANSTRVATRLPQAAIVDGLAQVSPGRNLQGAPYIGSRSFKTRGAAAGADPSLSKHGDTSVGGDAKVVLHDSLVLDGTINPDFSQVESDQPQVTVNKPFEVFFPEKRPFFLENAAYFSTPIPLLFTRRIADPLVGGRATGRFGPYALGAMVVDDRAPAEGQSNGPKAWLSVARLVRDIGSESFVGVFLSERLAAASANKVGAIDTRLRLGANWFASAQGAVTQTTEGGTSNSGSSFLASLVGSGRRFNYQLGYSDRSSAFHVVDGFIPRVDTRSLDQTYSFRARPATGGLQAWGPDVVLNRTWDHEGRPLDYAVTPRWAWQWPRTTLLDAYYTAARQTLRPSEVPSLMRPIDAAVDRAGLDFQSAVLPRFIGAATFFVGDAPNLAPVGGVSPPASHITDATATATVRLSRSLMIDASYLFDQLRDRRTDAVVYRNSISRVRLGEQFTRALAVRAIVQYTQLAADSTSTSLSPARNLNYDVLLTFLRSPGTAFYVGANYNLADIDVSSEPTVVGFVRTQSLHNTGWQVFTKASYLFRW